MKTTALAWMSYVRPCPKRNESGVSRMSFRVCIACYGIRVYPYMGFMVGQQYECQDCQERMVVPLEFDTEEDYRAFRQEMLGDAETSEE